MKEITFPDLGMDLKKHLKLIGYTDELEDLVTIIEERARLAESLASADPETIAAGMVLLAKFDAHIKMTNAALAMQHKSAMDYVNAIAVLREKSAKAKRSTPLKLW